MRVMLPYWTNSGIMPDDDCQGCNRNVANKVLLSTVTVQDLLPEVMHTDQISTESRFLQSVYCTTCYTEVVYRTAELVLGPKSCSH